MKRVVLCVALMLAAPALGQECTGDADGDGQVTIDEILASVNSALGGCPITPSSCIQRFNQDLRSQPLCIFQSLCGSERIIFLGGRDGFATAAVMAPDSTMYLLAEVRSATQARVIGVANRADWIDLQATEAEIMLEPKTGVLGVTIGDAGFVDAECRFGYLPGRFVGLTTSSDAEVVDALATVNPHEIRGGLIQHVKLLP